MTDLCACSAGTLARLIRDGEISAAEVTRAHLERIEQVNPGVNAVVTLVAEQAVAAAGAADRRRASGAALPPLHGVPILHKDTHATAGIRTTLGSPILADNVPDVDELIIARLRAAGTIALGKTNVPEFAAGSHTFNPLFGLTRNPYDPTRSAGGSSGGAAVALATGMCPIADGSDFGGSLRNPAAFCNVLGLRPTIGRVPTHPDPLPWHNLSVGGPMARTVDDLALMLSVIAGPDPRVPLSLDEPGGRSPPCPSSIRGRCGSRSPRTSAARCRSTRRSSPRSRRPAPCSPGSGPRSSRRCRICGEPRRRS